MPVLIDGFMILKNEEELVSFALESFYSLRSILGVLSLVENGSTDSTLDIIEEWSDRLPIVLQHEHHTAHHGALRNLALSRCTAPWIYYLDADESHSSDMLAWLTSGIIEQTDAWDHWKITTIVDRYHTVEGGNGPCYRLFRNMPGVTFTQNVHTEAYAPGMRGRMYAGDKGPILQDHTACKSREALWDKGWRYQTHFGTVGIGPPHEYIGRVEDAHARNLIREIEPHICARIFTGPL